MFAKYKRMPVNELLLRIAMVITATICGVVFVAVRYEPLMNILIGNRVDNGDLMIELNVADFRIEVIPDSYPRLPENEALNPDSAKVLLIGDSFCRRGYDCYPFGDELTLRTGKAVLWWTQANTQTRPFSWLTAHGVTRSETRRLLIFECVERNLVYYYNNDIAIRLDAVEQAQVKEFVLFKDFLRDEVRRWMGSAEMNYAYLANASVLTAGAIETLNTFKFHQFGVLPSRFPVYSLDPPMAFSYYESNATSQTSYFFDHTDENVQNIARTIRFIKEGVDEKFNLDLLFLIVPNKITIYHELATDVPYDDFLPRLSRQLKIEGVNTVCLYEPFRKANKQLYFAADSHWNRAGLLLGVEETAQAIEREAVIEE